MTHFRRFATLALLSALALPPALMLGVGCGHKNAADATAGAGAGKADARPPVQVALVHIGVVEQTLAVTGTLNPLPTQEAIITPPVSGVLDRLPIRLGQTVLRGQEIAHLATRTLQGQIQQAQATIGQSQVQVQQAKVNVLQQRSQTRTGIAQAQATLAGTRATLKREQATLTGSEAALQNAQQSLARQQTLLTAGVVARKDLEAAQLAVNTARAAADAQRQTVDAQREVIAGQQQAVTAARAAGLQDLIKQNDVLVAGQQVKNARGALATARAQVALYTLRAPITGEVTLVGASLGATVDGTTKIARIANIDRLQLQINVPSAQARQLRPGQPLRFGSESLPGRVYAATILRVGTQVDPANGTVQALAQTANPGHLLRDNSLVRVQIVTARRPSARLVPKDAILTASDTHKTSVVVIGADGVAHLRPVTVGLTAGGMTEVISGVQSGEQVAVTGQYALPDGAKVSVQKADGKASVPGAS